LNDLLSDRNDKVNSRKRLENLDGIKNGAAVPPFAAVYHDLLSSKILVHRVRSWRTRVDYVYKFWRTTWIISAKPY
jgi:hypothetical protein